MKYLIDTSALVRLLRDQVDPSWVRYADTGRFAICEPVLIEFLRDMGKREAQAAEAELLSGHDWVPMPAETGAFVRALRRDLTARSMQTMLSVADYLIAATAIQLKLTILHEDKDFCAVAKHFPQLSEQRISQALPED
jgi:predicted nucleic acid-binding protein